MTEIYFVRSQFIPVNSEIQIASETISSIAFKNAVFISKSIYLYSFIGSNHSNLNVF